MQRSLSELSAGPTGVDGAIFFLLIVLAAILGAWLVHDANKLAERVKVAERLMAEGMAEPDAMKKAGCNYWSEPWYKRLFNGYPRNHENK